ncbi:MAG: DNA translocase FtsK 4TM domain-containing protein [Thermodesulfovibrionales bacterium]|nr:DNA translocase FtsK 4TM domain-containing protein [Thermodesulfovibrionales bacterium]
MAERIKRVKDEVLGIVSILGGIYIGLSLVTHKKWDPSLLTFTNSSSKNYGGIVGAYMSDALLMIIGISAFAIPLFIVVYGVKRLLRKEAHRIHLIGALLFVLSSSILLSLMSATFNLKIESNPGGITGLFISDLTRNLLSIPGAYIFSLAIFLSSIVLLSPVSLVSLILRGRKNEAGEEEQVSEPLIEENIIQGAESLEPFLTESARQFEQEAPLLKPVNTRLRRAGDYTLPSLELLNVYDSGIRPSKDELLASSSLLVQKLSDFDVDGKITQVQAGPIVTMYEFEPAPGVKINRVVSLSDDLALALKAPGVRVSPISGKSAIGIEVPNRLRETVSLREIVSADSFMKNHSRLTLALGKDIFGNPVISDLAKMPHLLVAGATGSGKSVSINSMVMSILYKASPKEVKMLMIDPKLLELSAYEGIPHLISPVITNPKEAAEALRKMVFEMENRYRLLAQKSAKNIENYNKVVSEEEHLPYIVIFIDELADLMFASANEVEDAIARLAQMARASGIHLVLATQRPSVDVITGVIKANFPARISFHVTTRIDSRTILDAQGAEQLLGKGDMLFMLPGTKIIRIHGALITEDEIKTVTDFIRAQGVPDYSIFENIQIEEPMDNEFSAERDEMYHKAVEHAESVGEVSISSIQRRFKIGYNRAASIMELMEEDGLVGPQKGAGKPRDFLRRRR